METYRKKIEETFGMVVTSYCCRVGIIPNLASIFIQKHSAA
jgi:hypothetical protein